MSVFQKEVRLKRRDTGFHINTVFHEEGVDKPKPLRLRKPGLHELAKQSRPHPLSSAMLSRYEHMPLPDDAGNQAR